MDRAVVQTKISMSAATGTPVYFAMMGGDLIRDLVEVALDLGQVCGVVGAGGR